MQTESNLPGKMTNQPPPGGIVSSDERERLIFQLLLVNKWFLIPTSVAYVWILSTSIYQREVYSYTLRTILYTAVSLVFILLIWLAHRRLAEKDATPQQNQATHLLDCASIGIDVAYILFLAFIPKAGNILWILFLPPIALILLTPRLEKWNNWIIDGPAALVMLAVLYSLLFSIESAASPFFLKHANMLLSLSGLLFIWVNLRMVRRWLDSMQADLAKLISWTNLGNEIVQRFPTEFLLVNDQGELIAASESARKLLELPEDGSREWPEPVQPIRNALLLRFHAETKIDDTITVPDDAFPHPIKIYPTYFMHGDKRYCIAIAQEENPEIPKQAAILRSDRLSIAGQIAAGLAHELGNPLGVIQSCASYLRQKVSPEDPNREEFELIEKEAKRCQNLIDRLLSLASPKRDAPGVHDLRDIVRHAYSLVKYQAGDRDIEFHSSNEAMQIYGNEGQLIAVFVNLYLNALQSMENSPPEAKLRIHMRTRGEEAIVDVTDEGEGISKDELDKIFDPFYTQKASGTGLGLSIVHQIITSLNGRIDVASTKGSGTTFSIRLPLYKDET